MTYVKKYVYIYTHVLFSHFSLKRDKLWARLGAIVVAFSGWFVYCRHANSSWIKKKDSQLYVKLYVNLGIVLEDAAIWNKMRRHGVVWTNTDIELAIMTVPTTVVGVSFFFPDFNKPLCAHQTIGAVAIVVTINVWKKCKQPKCCSNLSIRTKCMHNSKPLKYHWRPGKGYLHLVHAFVMANTFIDLDPETIEAPFLGRNVGEKNADIAESDRDRMRLHCKRKLAELRSNGDPGGPTGWDQKVNKMVNIRKFEDAIVYMWLLQSSVSTIDAVDGFAMYAHCGAPRSKLASQPLGNASMAGAMSHPWSLPERPFRQLLVCRSFDVVCVIYFKTGMNKLHQNLFANSTTKFPTILVSNVRDGQIFATTPIGLNVWETIENQKQFIFFFLMG